MKIRVYVNISAVRIGSETNGAELVQITRMELIAEAAKYPKQAQQQLLQLSEVSNKSNWCSKKG